MIGCRRARLVCCAVLLLLDWSVVPCAAQTARSMIVVTPFTQGKVTMGMSNVTYRVVGVFAEATEPAQHLSLTFECKEGRKFSLSLAHKRVPEQTARVGIQVDDQAPQRIEASRKVDGGLTGYAIDNTTDAVALARTLAAGKRLRLQLDEYAYDIPLQGLDAALGRLAAVCPYG